jgi:hypothetical protein
MRPSSLLVASLAKFVPQQFDVQPEVVQTFCIGRRYGDVRYLGLYFIEFSKIFFQAFDLKILLYLGVDLPKLGIPTVDSRSHSPLVYERHEKEIRFASLFPPIK